ncbi:MAG: hypothetical protein Q8L69_15430 [Gallionellaceae bacterium]|nr:hypothetical protein [Gallionellaceae bacterium]
MEAPRQFRYRIGLPDGSWRALTVAIDPGTMVCREPAAEARPWTALEHRQCPGCPLRAETSPLCPLAARLAPIVTLLGPLLSHDELRVEVEWEHRQLVAKTTAQRITSSVIGLVAATSGCPHTAFLAPMAWFHLPLATEEETVFRAVSTYLLEQYIGGGENGAPDRTLAALTQRYKALHEVNMAMAQRLRDAGTEDAAVNAVVLLDLLAKAIPFSVEDSLESLRPLFAAAQRA